VIKDDANKTPVDTKDTKTDKPADKPAD